MEKGEERVEAMTGVEWSGVVVEESKKSEKTNVIADLKDPGHESSCPYCDE